jgi:hypothetical protein
MTEDLIIDPKFFVYFNKDTGDIKSITNESTNNLDTYITLPYTQISEFVSGKKSIFDYRVILYSGEPTFVKNVYDINSTLITEVPDKEEKDGILIENFTSLGEWRFSISESKKAQFEKYNLNSFIEIYIVDIDNFNYLYRTIKIQISELVKNNSFVVTHKTSLEKKSKRIKVLTNTSFSEINIKTKKKNVRRNKSN